MSLLDVCHACGVEFPSKFKPRWFPFWWQGFSYRICEPCHFRYSREQLTQMIEKRNQESKHANHS